MTSRLGNNVAKNAEISGGPETLAFICSHPISPNRSCQKSASEMSTTKSTASVSSGKIWSVPSALCRSTVLLAVDGGQFDSKRWKCSIGIRNSRFPLNYEPTQKHRWTNGIEHHPCVFCWGYRTIALRYQAFRKRVLRRKSAPYFFDAFCFT